MINTAHDENFINILCHYNLDSINVQDINGDTPLIWTVKNNKLEYFNILINKQNIDVNIRNNNNKTALSCIFDTPNEVIEDAKITYDNVKMQMLYKLLDKNDIDVNSVCEYGKLYVSNIIFIVVTILIKSDCAYMKDIFDRITKNKSFNINGSCTVNNRNNHTTSLFVHLLYLNDEHASPNFVSIFERLISIEGVKVQAHLLEKCLNIQNELYYYVVGHFLRNKYILDDVEQNPKVYNTVSNCICSLKFLRDQVVQNFLRESIIIIIQNDNFDYNYQRRHREGTDKSFVFQNGRMNTNLMSFLCIASFRNEIAIVHELLKKPNIIIDA